jgi:hypothetical protein
MLLKLAFFQNNPIFLQCTNRSQLKDGMAADKSVTNCINLCLKLSNSFFLKIVYFIVIKKN